MDIDDDNALLLKFISTLKDRGFFAGLTEGTPEWTERHSKARAKFHERYTKTPPSSAPVGAGAGSQGTSVDALRERLAAETKRMEQAEALKAQVIRVEGLWFGVEGGFWVWGSGLTAEES